MNNFEYFQQLQQSSSDRLAVDWKLLNAYLAQCFLEGRATRVDEERALFHFRLSAQEGDPRSKKQLLKIMFAQTQQPVKKRKREVRVIGRAEATVDQQDELILRSTSPNLDEDEESEKEKNLSTEDQAEDGMAEEAMKCLHELADEEGDLEAMQFLSQLYMHGYERFHVKPHIKKSIDYLKQAADRFNDLLALKQLALYYLQQSQLTKTHPPKRLGSRTLSSDSNHSTNDSTTSSHTDETDPLLLAVEYLKRAAHDHQDVTSIRSLCLLLVQYADTDTLGGEDEDQQNQIVMYLRMGADSKDSVCIRLLVERYLVLYQQTQDDLVRVKMLEYLEMGADWDGWCASTLKSLHQTHADWFDD